jgi:predicted O-methyltransferase YrrM
MDKKQIPKTIIYNEKNLIQYVDRNENYQNTKDYQVSDLIKELYATQKIEVQNGETRDLQSVVRPYVGYLAYRIIKDNNFSKVLEIGTGYGMSMLYMLEGLKNSKSEENKVLTSVDPYQSGNEINYFGHSWENGALISAYKSGLKKYLEFYELPSSQVIPIFYREHRAFDLIFIHGTILFDYKMLDIFYANKLLAVGGIVMIGGTTFPSDIKTQEYIENNYKNWKKIKNNFTDQSFFSIYLKISEDDRNKYYHKDF